MGVALHAFRMSCTLHCAVNSGSNIVAGGANLVLVAQDVAWLAPKRFACGSTLVGVAQSFFLTVQNLGVAGGSKLVLVVACGSTLAVVARSFSYRFKLLRCRWLKTYHGGSRAETRCSKFHYGLCFGWWLKCCRRRLKIIMQPWFPNLTNWFKIVFACAALHAAPFLALRRSLWLKSYRWLLKPCTGS